MESTSRYIISKKIGSGAMADVFLAKDVKLERQVAIKKIHSHLIEKQGLKNRFLKEALTLASFSHKNIVTLYDVVDEESPYLVMEYIQGRTLSEIMEAHIPIKGLVLLEIARQILQGLEYAHGKKIIHRDIKPSNIMLTNSGLIQLMDFGIAHVFQKEPLTLTGQFMGTPQYSSPEIIQGRPLSPETDVFSLCCLMYQCLTGTTPFTGESTHELLQNIVKAEPLPVAQYDPQCLSFLQDLLAQGLVKDPQNRISAAEMCAKIQAYQKFLNLPQGRGLISKWLESPEKYKHWESHELQRRFEELAAGAQKAGEKVKYHKFKHEGDKFRANENVEPDVLASAVRSNRSVKWLSFAMLGCLLVYVLLFFLSKKDKHTPVAVNSVKDKNSETSYFKDSTFQKKAEDSSTNGSGTGIERDIVTLNHNNSQKDLDEFVSNPKPSQSLKKSSTKRIKKALPKLGYLMVKTKPPFVKVNINGRFMAVAPFKTPLGLPPGEYSLSMHKKGWQALTEKIRIKSTDTLQFTKELKPKG